jgi:hypothetical protein
MKKEIENFANKAASDIATKPISRKEAIKKTGYIAVSAATMMFLLKSPAQACGYSHTPPKPKPPHGGPKPPHGGPTPPHHGPWPKPGK